MFCQIGNIRCEVVTIFEEIQGQHGQDYVEHPVIGRKPKLQSMGPKLSGFQLTFHLHAAFARSPRQQFQFLKDSMDTRKAMPFIFGDGYYRGEYVITDLVEGLEFMDGNGRIIEMSGSLTLKEYALEDAEAELRAKAAAQASSVGNRFGVPTVTRLPTDTPSVLGGALSGQAGFNGVGVTSSLGGILGSVISPFNSIMQVFGGVTGELSAIAGAVNTITNGKVNLSPVLGKINTVSNSVGNVVLKGNTVLGAIGGIGNAIGSITRAGR